MQLIDTHCHLYSEDYNEDLEQIVDKCKKAGVERIYMPGIFGETHAAMLSLEAKYPGYCFSMIGLHPCEVKDNYKRELDEVKKLLDSRSFVAVGEIGLDFYHDKTFAEQQYEAFDMQMQWALEKNLPINIHTRNAMQETIDMVKPFAQKGLKGIFHCFGGSYESAKQIIDLGFLLGIGGVVTYKNAGLPEVLQKIDLQHIVLETDAPYLSPVPHRGKRNDSSYLTFIAAKIAEIKNVTPAEVGAITSRNALDIYGN